jgi:glucose-6-phosphate 1-epimerase
MPTDKPQDQPASLQPGRVSFTDGQGELPMLEITTAISRAELYLNGAHVTHFSRAGEPPLLFMSHCSRFDAGQPIRGGIPVIFPWFGPREGMAQHGFARNKTWELKEFAPAADGSVSVRLRLPDCPEASSFPPLTADYVVTVSDRLRLELIVTNQSAEESLTFENCLHTYLEVSDITAVSVTGLKGATYLDKVANFAQRTEASDRIRISSEVDRIYLNTPQAVEVEDPRLGRRIRIEKQGSLSTVVWNPWIAKAQQMPDFGNDEYQRMICVESGNVSSDQITLPPRESSKLIVELSSLPLNGRS